MDTPFNDFKNKLQACFPIGYELDLLTQNNSDIACDWRRIRICYKGKYRDISVTLDHTNLNLGELADWFVKPICKIMNEDKMTREEATYKIQRKGFYGDRAGELVDALEALGLLKFEEPETPYTMHLVPRGSTATVEIYTDSMIKMLRSIGYKVEK